MAEVAGFKKLVSRFKTTYLTQLGIIYTMIDVSGSTTQNNQGKQRTYCDSCNY